MPIAVPQIDAVIPDGIVDLAAYRQWAHSDDFPEEGRFAYLDGTIWMDLTMEQIYSHVGLKTEFAIVLGGVVRSEDLGQFFTDGVLLSHLQANFANEPDALFVSFETLERGALRAIPGKSGGAVEFVGIPDMILEIVSKSSVKKDTSDLMDLYFCAGIPEYWLADARRETLRFSIYRPGPNGYEEVARDADGWAFSTVFARSFRLTRGVDRAGDPKFTLEVR